MKVQVVFLGGLREDLVLVVVSFGSLQICCPT